MIPQEYNQQQLYSSFKQKKATDPPTPSVVSWLTSNFLGQGSVYCQLKQCVSIRGTPLKISIHLYCLIPPKIDNLMTPVRE